jgi:hypothetical protein
VKWAVLLVAVSASGCAQLLGLDDTKFLYKDASVDAPNACDGAPACVSMTGRSVCGQLFGTGAQAGELLRVAAPTGTACAAGSTDGPCALSVYGQSEASFFAGTSTDRIAGTIDDCGRFVVPDLDPTAPDVAVVFNGPNFVTTASLVLGRMTTQGVDKDVPAFAAVTTTLTDWGTQLSTTVSDGYLVTEADTSGPLATEEVWVGGGPVSGPPNPPWSAYFTGGKAFGTLDPNVKMTDASGSSLVVPAASGSFMLGGKRMGHTCMQVSVEPVAGALIHITLSC